MISKRQQLTKASRNKYNAKKVRGAITGRMYDSKAEADYRIRLQADVDDKKIANLFEQTVVNLAGVNYRTDFDFDELTPTGEIDRHIWLEVKGAEGERFRVIKQLWRYHGPGILRIVRRKHAKAPFQIVKEIWPLPGDKGDEGEAI
jgi:hypothetical protein